MAASKDDSVLVHSSLLAAWSDRGVTLAARWPWSASSRCCGVSGGSSASSSPETARSGERGAIAVISVASVSSSQAHGQRTKDKGQRTQKRKRLATKTAHPEFEPLIDEGALTPGLIYDLIASQSDFPSNPTMFFTEYRAVPPYE